MTDDLLDFTALFILLFSESLKQNKSFFYLYLLDFTSVKKTVSHLIYRLSDLHSVEGCHSLEVSFMEISTFFMFYKPGSFFINALSLTNTLYSGMKNKLSLGFSDTKKIIEKNRRVIDPCGDRHWPLFGHFSHSLLFHFCIFLKT